MAAQNTVTDKELAAELVKIASVVLGKSKLRDEFIASLPKDAKHVARQISREIDTSTQELVKDMQVRAQKLVHELTEQASIELVHKHLAVIEHYRDALPDEVYEIFKTAVVVSAKKAYTANDHLGERAD
jgi:sulfur relay (sulfurtransferase) DsrC/TusE family protein